MPTPLAVCLEDLEASSPAERFLRCVAAVGRRSGLRVDARGEVLWRSDERVACELWVSADDRLILYRPEGAASVVVRRSGRTLDAPAAKPVVLLDQDQLEVGARRLRVHVHGPTMVEFEPSWLPAPAATRGSGLPRAAAAAALALGAALGAAGCPQQPTEPRQTASSDAGNEEIEVREIPPSPPLYEPPPPPPPAPEPIEVRQEPPDMGPAQE